MKMATATATEGRKGVNKINQKHSAKWRLIFAPRENKKEYWSISSQSNYRAFYHAWLRTAIISFQFSQSKRYTFTWKWCWIAIAGECSIQRSLWNFWLINLLNLERIFFSQFSSSRWPWLSWKRVCACVLLLCFFYFDFFYSLLLSSNVHLFQDSG